MSWKHSIEIVARTYLTTAMADRSKHGWEAVSVLPTDNADNVELIMKKTDTDGLSASRSKFCRGALLRIRFTAVEMLKEVNTMITKSEITDDDLQLLINKLHLVSHNVNNGLSVFNDGKKRKPNQTTPPAPEAATAVAEEVVAAPEHLEEVTADA